MGVPGIVHAFYVIHTAKDIKRSQSAGETPSSLPSLAHLERYRQPASFSPYEDQPPPPPPKREGQLPYDPALHPNAEGLPIGRAKGVLHTYQIPESTLHPPPLPKQLRRSIPPEPESQLFETSTSLPYPAEYHPNSAGVNIDIAKAVLHTYQIPETTFPAPQNSPATDETREANRVAMKTSMWSLRSKGKGLVSLDVDEATTIPKSESTNRKWATSGPSWLRRRKAREEQSKGILSPDEEEPADMNMVWNDNFEGSRFADSSSKQSKTHSRSVSAPVPLAFPLPPGPTRPAIDRTGTSNTALLRPLARRESPPALAAVAEDAPQPERAVSEGETTRERLSRSREHTSTENLRRAKSKLMSRLSRRHNRQQPDTARAADVAPPVPPKTETESQKQTSSPSWPRHIAPPAILAASIDEPRPGIARRGRTLSEAAVSSSATRTKVPPLSDSVIGELRSNGVGDAYSPSSLPLYPKERSPGSTPRGLASARPTARRLTVGTFSPHTSETASSRIARREWTQGTFGTEGNKSSSSTDSTSDEDLSREPTRLRVSPRDRARTLQGTRPDIDLVYPTESGLAGIGTRAVKRPELRVARVTNPDLPSMAHDDPFRDPAPCPAANRFSHATSWESLPSPISPERPNLGRAEPVLPFQSPTLSHPPETLKPYKPTPLRMPTFGSPDSRSSFGLLSPPGDSAKSAVPPVPPKFDVPPLTSVPIISPPRPPAFLKPGSISSKLPPPLPARVGMLASIPRSPKVPPKPTGLRMMFYKDDDMSDTYSRALRDEI
ncbi:hypothetical protein CTheo_3201 [Ceratobasidium theobromae]|uniref:Uncharacterized protein n=1 Tax=Ceratobasidium theobromae TaxID=1582974 RepID=A0A5N5QNZ3_9AGAM|nr:hypothetical protein CTheo_3201 [Ceratobasidium theobromae]